jgi:hypothetical protein
VRSPGALLAKSAIDSPTFISSVRINSDRNQLIKERFIDRSKHDESTDWGRKHESMRRKKLREFMSNLLLGPLGHD